MSVRDSHLRKVVWIDVFLTCLSFRPHEYKSNLSMLKHGTCAYTRLLWFDVSSGERHTRNASYGQNCWGMDVRIPEGVKYHVTTASGPAMESRYRLVHWVSGVLSPGVKRPVQVAGHSPPSNAELKNEWNHASIYLYVWMTYMRSALPLFIVLFSMLLND
jgi:hypothetical protein